MNLQLHYRARLHEMENIQNYYCKLNKNLNCCLNVQTLFCFKKLWSRKVFLLPKTTKSSTHKQQFIKFPATARAAVSVNDSFRGVERNFAICNTAIFPFECRNYFPLRLEIFISAFQQLFIIFILMEMYRFLALNNGEKCKL